MIFQKFLYISASCSVRRIFTSDTIRLQKNRPGPKQQGPVCGVKLQLSRNNCLIWFLKQPNPAIPSCINRPGPKQQGPVCDSEFTVGRNNCLIWPKQPNPAIPSCINRPGPKQQGPVCGVKSPVARKDFRTTSLTLRVREVPSLPQIPYWRRRPWKRAKTLSGQFCLS